MNDEAFIGYCELHCDTPRALFSARDVERILKLAGEKCAHKLEGFYHVYADQMMPLCKAARARLAAPAIDASKPSAKIIQFPKRNERPTSV